MCEAFIQVTERPVSRSAQTTAIKPGDVVVVHPDGWGWGTDEQESQQGRIVKFPGVPVTALSSLTVEMRTLGSQVYAAKYSGFDIDSLAMQAVVRSKSPVLLPPALLWELLDSVVDRISAAGVV